MAINLTNGFDVHGPVSIDKRMTMSKAEMKAINPNIMPPVYFTLCTDDKLLYIYDQDNMDDSVTGKFRVESGAERFRISSHMEKAIRALDAGTVVQFVGNDYDNYQCGHFYKSELKVVQPEDAMNFSYFFEVDGSYYGNCYAMRKNESLEATIYKSFRWAMQRSTGPLMAQDVLSHELEKVGYVARYEFDETDNDVVILTIRDAAGNVSTKTVKCVNIVLGSDTAYQEFITGITDKDPLQFAEVEGEPLKDLQWMEIQLGGGGGCGGYGDPEANWLTGSSETYPKVAECDGTLIAINQSSTENPAMIFENGETLGIVTSYSTLALPIRKGSAYYTPNTSAPEFIATFYPFVAKDSPEIRSTQAYGSMPAASSVVPGIVIQYIGESNSSYLQGNFYVSNGTQWSPITLAGVVPQMTNVPAASSENYGQIIQFGNGWQPGFTQGRFYQSGTAYYYFKWVEVVLPMGGGNYLGLYQFPATTTDYSLRDLNSNTALPKEQDRIIILNFSTRNKTAAAIQEYIEEYDYLAAADIKYDYKIATVTRGSTAGQVSFKYDGQSSSYNYTMKWSALGAYDPTSEYTYHGGLDYYYSRNEWLPIVVSSEINDATSDSTHTLSSAMIHSRYDTEKAYVNDIQNFSNSFGYYNATGGSMQEIWTGSGIYMSIPQNALLTGDNLASARVSYPIRIGTYFDNKPIYRMTIEVTKLTGSNFNSANNIPTVCTIRSAGVWKSFTRFEINTVPYVDTLLPPDGDTNPDTELHVRPIMPGYYSDIDFSNTYVDGTLVDKEFKFGGSTIASSSGTGMKTRSQNTFFNATIVVEYVES